MLGRSKLSWGPRPLITLGTGLDLDRDLDEVVLRECPASLGGSVASVVPVNAPKKVAC